MPIRTGARARFARLPLPDAPEGRVQLVRHLTPEAIWQERFMGHPNRAVALEAAILAVAEPAETAARLSRLAGLPVTPDPAGGFALELGRGLVRILPEAALGAGAAGVDAPGAAVHGRHGGADRGRRAGGSRDRAGVARGPGRLDDGGGGGGDCLLLRRRSCCRPMRGSGPDSVGAIGLLVHRLARAGAGGVVLGMPIQGRAVPRTCRSGRCSPAGG